jgi:hypothetical protein
VTQLTRAGAAIPQTLAAALDTPVAEIEAALAVLQSQGQLVIDEHGQATLRLGRTRPRAVPARLWPALTTSGRLYSAQEIATLRTVIPILQFARAKLSEFADHGPGHVLRVKSFATQLGYLIGLSDTEHHLLRMGALFHDVGNIVERARHHEISQETVERLTARGELPFSAREALLIGLLCRWHRKAYDPQRCDELAGQPIRTGLLASLLRVADAMDIDQRRVDYPAQFMDILRFFYPDELPYWSSLGEIVGVRIRSRGAVTLQVFTDGSIQENMQIAMLEEDLAQTPLPWTVQTSPVLAAEQTAVSTGSSGAALLVYPFDPHSLIMAALSRSHLQAAGFTVQVFCYPDHPTAAAWLWGEALPAHNPTAFRQLVVIGDQPAAAVTPQLLRTLTAWQQQGTAISVLNRHEANWARLPVLVAAGIDVTVGGDWAYFWGETLTPHELAWARVAALCTRDPTQSTVGVTELEQLVLQGMLKTVYDTLQEPPTNLAEWTAAATTILDHVAIEPMDVSRPEQQSWFTEQGRLLPAVYALPSTAAWVEGRVLLLDLPSTAFRPAAYWLLEMAIEQQGRLPVRGICFRTPYAIASWIEGDTMHLLAINHWREEAATPIRLLYTADAPVTLAGNESTVWLQLPLPQAQTVIEELVAACNQVIG